MSKRKKPHFIVCPACKASFPASEAARQMGAITSPAKARAVRENGKLGGRPKKVAPETKKKVEPCG